MTVVEHYLRGWQDPWYAGEVASVSRTRASKYDVMINGRGYMIDWRFPEPYKFASVPMINPSFLQDRGTAPIGEHSLTPHDYWRRSVDDWSAGAGQRALDHEDSKNNRFNASKGIDPWTAGSLALLNVTEMSAAQDLDEVTVLKMVVAGSDLWVLADDALYEGDTTTLTAVTDAAPDDPLSGAVDIASDGYTIWVADANRIHYALRGGSTFDKYHTSDHTAAEFVRTAKGRLFTAKNNVLYTHSGTAGSATAAAYFTHPSSDWTWTDVAGGPDAIYFSGYAGDHSAIYAATIMADGTDLDAPVVVATLPSGETARSLHAYLSVLMVGTDKGLRMAVLTGQSGSVILGGLIEMGNPPLCFESQSRFVWFGWTSYDATSSGLGRVDLSVFNEDVPAYASDLMCAGAGAVTSIVTLPIDGVDRRVFSVLTQGICVETVDKVASGTITSGLINYDLAENKLAVKVSIAHAIGAGSYAVALSVDDGTPVQLGGETTTTAATGGVTVFPAPPIQGRGFETTLTLTRDETDTESAPNIDRWTLMCEPQPERRAQFVVPILLHATMRDRLNSEIHVTPSEERRIIYDLMISRSPIVFQDREETYTVIVDDFTWVPYEHVGSGRQQGSWDGTLQTSLKIVG